MAINKMMKLVKMMTMMEFIIVAAAAVGQNGGYDQKDFSPRCLLSCLLQCASSGLRAPLCFATCLLQCRDPPVESDPIKNCTSTCAQSVCSKYGSDMNILEDCVVNNCARKCIAGA